jgi:hypothetical protein
MRSALRFIGVVYELMLRLFLIYCCLVVSLWGQGPPQVTVSPIQVVETDPIDVRGTGFTPNGRVVSHLRRPDRTEYDVIWFTANNKGEISHTIDTLLLAPGTHELWVIDDTTKVASNVARLAVDFQVDVPSPPEAEKVLSSYIGVWRGSGILIAITGGNTGPVAGVISNATSGCAAVLAFRKVFADSLELLQTTNEARTQCVPGGVIRLKLNADGQIVLSGAATGTLSRLRY